MKFHHRSAVLALALTVPLSLAACGGSTSAADNSSDSTTPSMASSPSADSPMGQSPSASDAPMATGGATNAMAKPFGPGCTAVPKDGKGSFQGMAADPVATAASHNPLLSTLVGAVKKAGLVDTLNSTQGITVFAPTNKAFEKVPAATMKKAMNDPKGLLSTVLTGHVVKGRIAPDQLAGTHKSLAGTTIKVKGSGDSFTVDGNAKVLCGNVQTANATVYIIDGVLLP